MSSRLVRNGALIVLLAIVSVMSVAILNAWRLTGDFAPHTVYIERIMAGDPDVFTELPNFLYHVSVIVPALFIPQAPLTTWIVPVSLIWSLLLAALIWWQMRAAIANDEMKAPTSRGEIIAVVLTLMMLIIGPITLLTPDNQYFGYMTPYVYHNPTMIPLRPIAVLLLIGAVSFASAEVATWKFFERRRELQMPLMAALTVASILAKPNFAMIFLPALIIWLVVLKVIRRHVDMPSVVMGIVVPGIAFLGYQAMGYSASSMAFRPFYTQDVWAINYDPQTNINLGLKILLSVGFPLVVTLLYLRRAVQSPLLILAWIAAVGGAMLTYLFYDPSAPPAGNLTWSGQIGVLVLHFAAMIFLVRRHPWLNRGTPADLIRFGVCVAVLILHVVSGIIWYSAHLTGAWPDLVYSIW